MFELARLQGTPESPIPLATRLGTPVRNSRSPSPSERARSIFSLLLRKHPQWVLRKEPCGYYNCFGLVWASRRTSIYEQDDLDRILLEDGYRGLEDPRRCRLGDLALYLDEAGGFLHVGVVAEIRQVVGGGVSRSGAPWILSKWNDSTGEVLHHYNDVPFALSYTVRFWTDREETSDERPR